MVLLILSENWCLYGLFDLDPKTYTGHLLKQSNHPVKVKDSVIRGSRGIEQKQIWPFRPLLLCHLPQWLQNNSDHFTFKSIHCMKFRNCVIWNSSYWMEIIVWQTDIWADGEALFMQMIYSKYKTYMISTFQVLNNI
jgi:hypothetical protein